MSNITFNSSQTGNSKLNKLMNIRNKYENDDKFFKLFYEVASHPNKNISLTIKNDGSYTLKNSNNSILLSGSLTKVEKSLINQATNYITGNPSEVNEKNEENGNYGEIVVESGNEFETEPEENEEGNQKKQPGALNLLTGAVSGVLGTTTEQEPENENENEPEHEPENENENESEHEPENEFEHEPENEPENEPEPTENEFEPEPEPELEIEGGKNNRSWWKKALGMSGGNLSDSEYESDDSIISSDEDLDDIVPFSTAFFDDDDTEEDLMEHIRNMKSKKFLKTLANTELREILRKNNQKISKNNNYLSKKDMIKSITQFYK